MRKRVALWLIRKLADDRNFRISICKELHNNAQTYFGEQTPYGRYYEACEEFFEACPRFTKDPIARGGVIAAFDNIVARLKN